MKDWLKPHLRKIYNEAYASFDPNNIIHPKLNNKYANKEKIIYIEGYDAAYSVHYWQHNKLKFIEEI